jgi:2-polyprenyl-3-methyl-5-hydroxy-6-metoxy-1,4-benzoquinol methylase
MGSIFKDRIVDLGVRAGVLHYRRRWVLSADEWDREYGKGHCDHYGDLRELARYSALIGYIRAAGRRPEILDIGCGTGVLRERLPEDAVGRYVGIDPSRVAIEQARARGCARSTFEVATTPSADLGRFDVVVCNEVLYYVDDLPLLLERIRELLKPGGCLVTSILRHPGDAALQRALDEHLERRDSVEIRSDSAAGHAWRVGMHVGDAGSAPGRGRFERALGGEVLVLTLASEPFAATARDVLALLPL